MLKSVADLIKERKTELKPFVYASWPNNEQSLRGLLKSKPSIKTVVEIGGFTGSGSTLLFAEAMKSRKEGMVVTIDLFDTGFFNPQEMARFVQLVGEMPTTDCLDLFLSNVTAKGYQDIVYPYKGTSQQFFATFIPFFGEGREIFCHIDGDHSYEGCLFDIQNCLKAFPGAILCGDDYGPFPGVTQAANEMTSKLEQTHKFWKNEWSLWVLEPKKQC